MSDCCSKKPSTRYIFPCSGAADVGELADRVARKLARDQFGKMYCLAAVGAGIESFIESTRSADENIAVDGCNIACSYKSLKNINAKVTSFILTDFGLEKGKTEISDDNINKAADKIKEIKAN